MIKIVAFMKDGHINKHASLEDCKAENVLWYWVDFSNPVEEETKLLETHFHFHPLAIEDCSIILQRPKLDYYKKANFFVTHALNEETLDTEEIDIFLAEKFIVSYHHYPQNEIDKVWSRLTHYKRIINGGPPYLLYQILDSIVDNYFPIVYQIEDELNKIDNNTKEESMEKLMEELFDKRGELQILRRTVIPMRDLLYRIIHSSHLTDQLQDLKEYYADIYDHLLLLSEKIESNREITADIRDSYLSINTHRMNRVMMVLTVITTIFMPLTFIAGIYGMNFVYMPELNAKYGYFVILAAMAFIGISMFLWFKKKGWFDNES